MASMIKYVFLRQMGEEFNVSMALSDNVPAHFTGVFNRLYGRNLSFRRLTAAFALVYPIPDVFNPWDYDEENRRKRCFIDAFMTLTGMYSLQEFDDDMQFVYF